MYKYDYPIDRMRDWNNEAQVSGGGYFWLSLIRAADFGANIYLAADGFEPVQNYLNDTILRVITNYKRIAYVSESDAANVFKGEQIHHLDREAPYDFTQQTLSHAELDAELDAYFVGL
jgi:hypothetical protein